MQDKTTKLDDLKKSSEASENVRGSDLRQKMINSQVYGEEFRSENQGTDQRVTSPLPDDPGKHNQTEHSVKNER